MRRTPLLVLALLLGCAADSPPEGVEAPGGTDGTPADGTDGTTASDGTDGTASDGTADGGDGTAPGAGENALADFSLEDLNPSSDTYGQPVSPRDTLEAVSGWYFVHAS